MNIDNKTFLANLPYKELVDLIISANQELEHRITIPTTERKNENKYKKLTKEDKANIIKLYHQQKKVKEISQELNIPKSTVYKITSNIKKHKTTKLWKRNGALDKKEE